MGVGNRAVWGVINCLISVSVLYTTKVRRVGFSVPDIEGRENFAIV